jgi:hypothetical protein
MPTLVLRESIPKIEAARSLARRTTETRRDWSLTGIVVFSSMGFGLTILAAAFQWLQLPPPFF